MRKVGVLTAFTRSDCGDLRSGKNRTEGYPDWGLRNYYFQRVGGLDQVFENPEPSVQVGSGYGQIDLLQKVKYQPTEHFYLVANFQYSANDDVPRYDRLTQKGSNKLKYAEWKYGQQRLLASLKARILKPAKLWDSGTAIYAYQRVDEDRFNRKFGNQRRSYNLEEVHINSFTVDFDKGLSADGLHKITYGVDVNHNNVISESGKINVNTSALSGGRLTRYPSGGSSQTQFGSYLDYRWRTADSLFNIRAGLRYSNISLNVNYIDSDIIVWPDEFYQGLTSKNDNLSYAAAITYNSKNGFQGRLIYSSAFRSPNIDDWAKIREKNGYVTIPNPSLQPELSPMNLEFTIAKEMGDTRPGRPGRGYKISGTSFYTVVEDAIVRRQFNLPDGSSTLLLDDEVLETQANINADRAIIMGLSGNFVAKFNEHWSGNASYNWIQGEAEQSEGESKPLSHIPPSYGRAGVTFQNDKWQIEGNVQFNGEKPWEDYAFDESDNEDQAIFEVGTPAWMTYNLYTNYKLNDKIGVNLGVENISDIHYRPFASGISAAGRNFIVSLRGKF
jgi:hemoglobin/transferrin/lactoferrin receptor protein